MLSVDGRRGRECREIRRARQARMLNAGSRSKSVAEIARDDGKELRCRTCWNKQRRRFIGPYIEEIVPSACLSPRSWGRDEGRHWRRRDGVAGRRFSRMWGRSVGRFPAGGIGKTAWQSPFPMSSLRVGGGSAGRWGCGLCAADGIGMDSYDGREWGRRRRLWSGAGDYSQGHIRTGDGWMRPLLR